jgi:hypothetical protein
MVMIAAGYDDCDDSNPDPMSGLKPRKMRATNGGRAGAAARAAHVAAERSLPSTRRVVALLLSRGSSVRTAGSSTPPKIFPATTRQQIQSKRRAEIGDQETIVGMYSDASFKA